MNKALGVYNVRIQRILMVFKMDGRGYRIKPTAPETKETLSCLSLEQMQGDQDPKVKNKNDNQEENYDTDDQQYLPNCYFNEGNPDESDEDFVKMIRN